ncbi:MAG: PA0069 family radical SAM protein [Gammaproteobacteria bacterium]|nr:PA0069 family radical SAM protein [Gammaproteobacteria bacterium]
METKIPYPSVKGRGACDNPDPRFTAFAREGFDDGWSEYEQETPALKTEILTDSSRTVISYNQSPDVPFDRSINPYKGCEHGCIYCFARPTHAYLDLSPGMDFETRIFAKPNAAELLEEALAKPKYRPATIALGVNTDAYQPIERKLGITRDILKVLEAHRHPVSIITKSSLIERDIDILSEMAEQNRVSVAISVTSLDHDLSRRLEPRAASPKRRLQTIRTLSDAGIPVGVLTAPVIPALNDSEIESILSEIASAGAQWAEYILLRLPHEVKSLFEGWLQQHRPLKATYVMNLIRDMRGGKAYASQFGQRMTGTGNHAELLAQRYKLACKKYGLERRDISLDNSLFRTPEQVGEQLALF